MADFEGYFLGARAVLDIFFEFALVMESGRKNKGAILHLLMQFKAPRVSSKLPPTPYIKPWRKITPFLVIKNEFGH